jgi:hypothetical protein
VCAQRVCSGGMLEAENPQKSPIYDLAVKFA